MEIKVDTIEYGNEYAFEIDQNDERIKTFKTKDVLNSELKMSPSFERFIKEVSNGLTIEIGNELTVFPIDSIEGFWTDIKSLTEELIEESMVPNDNFVAFGMSGVDSETWAFYTGKKFNNGEYPIVWLTPSSIDKEIFVLMNSRFDRFLTIQYHLLKSTDFEETMTYEEALNRSNDKNYMESVEAKYQKLIDSLYSKYDPIIPSPQEDFYQNAMTIEQLDELIDKINNAL